MRGFATSRNPYISGNRPRAFFSKRYEMLKKEMMLGKSTTKSSAKVEFLKRAYEKNAA
jgi:hypothetical protein